MSFCQLDSKCIRIRIRYGYNFDQATFQEHFKQRCTSTPSSNDQDWISWGYLCSHVRSCITMIMRRITRRFLRTW